jgi:hypothetical protein
MATVPNQRKPLELRSLAPKNFYAAYMTYGVIQDGEGLLPQIVDLMVQLLQLLTIPGRGKIIRGSHEEQPQHVTIRI